LGVPDGIGHNGEGFDCVSEWGFVEVGPDAGASIFMEFVEVLEDIGGFGEGMGYGGHFIQFVPEGVFLGGVPLGPAGVGLVSGGFEGE